MMGIENTYLVIPLFFFAALLFSSVGHGGASAYLALMALFGFAPETMRPTALLLNVLVSTIGVYKFYKAGAFSWGLFWPLVLTSIPLAFLGGQMQLPAQYYKPIVGLALVFAAVQVFRRSTQSVHQQIRQADRTTLFGLGAGLGLLSGLTGIGGGIFLSPVLLLCNWAETKVVSGVAAAFILANSMSGLVGVMSKHPALPESLGYWAIAVVFGAVLGAELGSKRLANSNVRKLLAVVILFAGVKMLLEGAKLFFSI